MNIGTEPAPFPIMLERIASFLKTLPGRDSRPARGDEDDPMVAAAALMFHVVNADGVLENSEKRKLRATLSQAYSLTGVQLERLMEAGEAADREAIDLFAFTRVLKRHLDAAQRIDFIGLLWELAYADGKADELEDNTVWRIAELIGVDSRDRIAARRRVRATTEDDPVEPDAES
jgi:uncharacterized tellurite resistance protein B-like protein